VTAAKSVEKLGTRTRVMDQKLRGVEKLPDSTAQLLLGAGDEQMQETEEGEAAADNSNILPLPASGT
jgi:DNA anti-recombination protein RmuC